MCVCVGGGGGHEALVLGTEHKKIVWNYYIDNYFHF